MENDFFFAFFTVPLRLKERGKSVVSGTMEIRILEWRSDHSQEISVASYIR
jgi:hypothetical protein